MRKGCFFFCLTGLSSLPKQLIKHLWECSVLGELKRISFLEVVFSDNALVIKPEDIVCGDAIYNFCRSESKDLLAKDVLKALILAGVKAFHLFTAIQALYDFGNIESRLHIHIDEGFVWHPGIRLIPCHPNTIWKA